MRDLVPTSRSRAVGLAAGEGLAASRYLLDELVIPALGADRSGEDSICIRTRARTLVVTADLYAVEPLVFPGGNVGLLAACGAINDLAAGGARLAHMSVGLYVSQHLDRSVLEDILSDLGAMVQSRGATVVCGDTKVHEGADPQLLISVTAFGEPLSDRDYALRNTRSGDSIIVSGPLGSHTIAVLSAREGLGFESSIRSDVSPVGETVLSLLAPFDIHSLRDLTRGGLAGAIWDGVRATGLDWSIQEGVVPIQRWVRAASDLLGLDPMLLTNEGCMLLTVPEGDAAEVLAVLRADPLTGSAAIVGHVATPSDVSGEPVAILEIDSGGRQLLPFPHGIGVPRLC